MGESLDPWTVNHPIEYVLPRVAGVGAAVVVGLVVVVAGLVVVVVGLVVVVAGLVAVVVVEGARL